MLLHLLSGCPFCHGCANKYFLHGRPKFRVVSSIETTSSSPHPPHSHTLTHSSKEDATTGSSSSSSDCYESESEVSSYVPQSSVQLKFRSQVMMEIQPYLTSCPSVYYFLLIDLNYLLYLNCLLCSICCTVLAVDVLLGDWDSEPYIRSDLTPSISVHHFILLFCTWRWCGYYVLMFWLVGDWDSEPYIWSGGSCRGYWGSFWQCR